MPHNTPARAVRVALDAATVPSAPRPRLDGDRNGTIPHWHPPEHCIAGHYVRMYDEHGAFHHTRWYGYKKGCPCLGCQREATRLAMRMLRKRGGMDRALHGVATAPRPLRAMITTERLPKFRSAAVDAAVAALDVAVPDHGPLEGFATIHPTGDSDPKAWAPHVDFFLNGEGLEALADDATLSHFLLAFRREWRIRLARLCRLPARGIWLPRAFARWYPDRDAAGERPDPRWSWSRALGFAIRDAVRSFPGWDLPVRNVCIGELRKRRAEASDEPQVPLFESGAIPLETLIEAHGAQGAEACLSRAEIRFYAARAAAVVPYTQATSPGPRGPVDPGVDGITLLAADEEADEGARRNDDGTWTIVVDLRGVLPLEPYDPWHIEERVRQGDTHLWYSLDSLAVKIKAMRRDPAARPALDSMRTALDSLRAAVERRARPSAMRAAEWLWETLGALAVRTEPEGLILAWGPRHIRGARPPLGISGLVARSEFAALHARAARVPHAPAATLAA